jgi:hypothetical protein
MSGERSEELVALEAEIPNSDDFKSTLGMRLIAVPKELVHCPFARA